MIEVWGRANSVNVQKVLWCCDELALPYTRYDAGGLFGGTKDEAYLSRNPTGLIPTISDGGIYIWESNAIVRHLSATYGAGTLWPEVPAERALADTWMDYGLGEIFPSLYPVLLNLIRTPPEDRDPDTVARAVQATARAFLLLDAHLADNDYVAGGSFTMGDVALGTYAHRLFNLDIERPPMPSLQAWYARLTERPAYEKDVMVSFAMEVPGGSERRR